MNNSMDRRVSRAKGGGGRLLVPRREIRRQTALQDDAPRKPGTS